jgi:hypothetical protein
MRLGSLSSPTIPGARNLPASRVMPEKDTREVRTAKDDGRLPMEDHNTRIIVLGRDATQAQVVAEAIAHEAFHNVALCGDMFVSLVQRSLGRPVHAAPFTTDEFGPNPVSPSKDKEPSYD